MPSATPTLLAFAVQKSLDVWAFMADCLQIMRCG